MMAVDITAEVDMEDDPKDTRATLSSRGHVDRPSSSTLPIDITPAPLMYHSKRAACSFVIQAAFLHITRPQVKEERACLPAPPWACPVWGTREWLGPGRCGLAPILDVQSDRFFAIPPSPLSQPIFAHTRCSSSPHPTPPPSPVFIPPPTPSLIPRHPCQHKLCPWHLLLAPSP